MHFSIPETQDLTDPNGSNFTVSRGYPIANLAKGIAFLARLVLHVFFLVQALTELISQKQ